MSRPARRMVPECGSNCPISWLISVVLPAPLGPMIACNSPFATSSETLSVATMPPNRRTSFSTRSRGSAMTQPPEQPDNAATPEQHDQQQQRAHDQRPVFGDLRQEFFQQKIDDRPITGPNSVPMPPRMTMTMRSPERVQYITAGLTKSVLLASNAPARPHMVPAMTKQTRR